MSYIDTIKHELVGFLNGLPIYHPLEEVADSPWGEDDFSCTPDNLIIGGGAGEHPALVIHELGALVASYLLLCLQKHNEFFPEQPDPLPIVSVDRLYEMAGRPRALEFCGWSMNHVREFVDLAHSPLHPNPLSEMGSAEEWIEHSIGEFVYYSLPELNPFDTAMALLPGMEAWFPGYWMCNVTCPPPNYVKTRKQSLLSGSFQDHGFFRWDYRYPPEE
ncbi:hypothetical protein [Dickeya zeae]|uniref:DUF596 domain-containing protein n=1 Tax=Dickeya zeae TaxID=204042 RepID=A0ABX8W126_9GAMM|nr:hypothetical protein [Dickeya zeae]MCO7263403.1 hypothetical protein [Dickeya zeae]QYM93898.1 hypothetical protein FGI21_19480 [Dickeya zeae]